MADAGDFAERLHVLDARAAVADLIHRYALNIRMQTPENIAALFTDDGEFHVRDTDPGADDGITERGRHVGRDALTTYFHAGRGGFRVFPMIRNLLIDVQGDAATSSCLMSSRSWPPGAEVFGEYQDSFRRDDGAWRFSRRVFTIYRKPRPAA